MRAAKKDRDEQLAMLREWIKPGDTVYTVLRHEAERIRRQADRVLAFGPGEWDR